MKINQLGPHINRSDKDPQLLAAPEWLSINGQRNRLFGVACALFDKACQTTSMAGRVKFPHSIVWVWCHEAGQASLQGWR